jgi:hypothetical protein
MRMKTLVSGFLITCLFASQCYGATWTITTPASPTSYPRGTTNVFAGGTCSAGSTAGDIEIVDSLGTRISTNLGITSGSSGPPYMWGGAVSGSPVPTFAPCLNCTFQVNQSGVVKATATVHFL